MSSSWPRQLWLLGVLGALLTLSVTTTAVVTIAGAVDAGQDLVLLNRAQRLHQDADMMHDALRADVAAAFAAVRRGSSSAGLARVTRDHVHRFSGDIEALGRLRLPEVVGTALASLRPAQQRFGIRAQRLVNAALHGSVSPGQHEQFDVAFDALATAQQAVTAKLADSTLAVEQAQQRQGTTAVRVLAAATAVALAGWTVLTLLHRRSGRRLARALGREAEQRAVAELLQQSLLPGPLPTVPGLRMAARSRTCESSACVGGDWYDAFALPTGDLAVVVGDAVGHDLRAAATMGQVRAAVRAFAVHEVSPAAVLERVNTVVERLEITDLTTCLYAVISPAARTVRWSSAGHPNPLLLSATSEHGVVLAGEPGPPLGAWPGADFNDRVLELSLGDSLLLYTDGLVERRSMSLDEGLSRLESIDGAQMDPDGLCDRVLGHLLADLTLTDDVTVLAVQA